MLLWNLYIYPLLSIKCENLGGFIYNGEQEHPGCQVYGQTVTTDHHDELIKMGINPSLKGTKATRQYPYVIFCAPPSRTSDYPGDVR